MDVVEHAPTVDIMWRIEDQEFDLTEALCAGLLDTHIVGTEKAVTDLNMDVIYGDTDSIMSALPLATLKGMSRGEIIEFSQFASLVIATLVNEYMDGLEVLQPEKIAELMLLPGMKKNYIMMLVGKLLPLFSGIEAKRRDSHPLVRTLTTDCVTKYMMDAETPPDELKERLMEMIAETKNVLNALVTNKLPHSQMVLSEKLAKITYKNVKEITVVRDKRLARREQVSVGERITYVLVDLDPTDAKQRDILKDARGKRRKTQRNVDMVECARYAAENAIPLNYEETFYRKISAPILKLYRPFIAPVTDFPNAEHLIREGISPDSKRGKKLIEKRRDEVFKYQDSIAAPIIFGPLYKQFERRRGIRYREVVHEDLVRERALVDGSAAAEGEMPAKKRPRTLFSFFKVSTQTRARERICRNCNDIFTGEKVLCNLCLSSIDGITLDRYEEYVADKASLAVAYDRCHLCVADTGFPELDVDQCTDFSCPTYEERSGLQFDVKAKRAQVDQFQKMGACRGRVFDW